METWCRRPGVAINHDELSEIRTKMTTPTFRT